MEFSRVTKFMDRIWDDEIIPALTDYIRIPNKSPAFDPDWGKHGYMEQVVAMFAAWANSKLDSFPGSSLEVVRLPGRTPLILIEIPGTHLDMIKQPHVGELANRLARCLAEAIPQFTRVPN